MQNPIRFGSALRAALFGLAAAAMAATGANAAVLVARATLATAVAEPRTANVDGINWTCAGTECSGTVENAGSRRQPAMTACRRLAQTVGPVATFERAGVAMSGGNLRHCNEAAQAAAH